MQLHLDHTGTETLPVPGDAALVAAVRGGDVAAFVTLVGRHEPAMRRLARVLDPLQVSEDPVSDALAVACTSLTRGHGPALALRPYLLLLVNQLHTLRAAGYVEPLFGDDAVFTARPFADHAVQGGHGRRTVEAVAVLPEAWQAVLWHLDVERDSPATVALLLGVPAGSVLALAERARHVVCSGAPESAMPGMLGRALADNLLGLHAAEYLTLAAATSGPPAQRRRGGLPLPHRRRPV